MKEAYAIYMSIEVSFFIADVPSTLVVIIYL